MRAMIALALLLTACGSSAVSPSPQPAPSPAPAPAPVQVTVNGRITETLTGASVGVFSQPVDRLPALLTVSAPGYITRQAYAGSSTPTVDLIRNSAPFSIGFYQQFARGTLENPILPLFVLAQAPSFYLQTTGLSQGNVDRLVAAAREIVPAMTGGRFTVTTIETGPDARPQRSGWIVVQIINDPSVTNCGRSTLGDALGQIFMNTVADCGFNGDAVVPVIFQHEIGHALGFSHVDALDALMHPGGRSPAGVHLSEQERYHAAIAYSRQRGNTDPDNDAVTSTPLSVRSNIMVVD